jgi:hypothetical protein
MSDTYAPHLTVSVVGQPVSSPCLPPSRRSRNLCTVFRCLVVRSVVLLLSLFGLPISLDSLRFFLIFADFFFKQIPVLLKVSYQWAPQLTPFFIGQSLQTPVFAILRLFKVYVKYLEYSSGFALCLTIFLPFPRFLVILLQVWKVPQALHCRHIVRSLAFSLPRLLPPRDLRDLEEPACGAVDQAIHGRASILAYITLSRINPTLLPQTALSTDTPI